MKPRIAVFSYNTFKYSETFIHNLVDRLPSDIHLFHGGEIPLYLGNDTPIIPTDGWRKMVSLFREGFGTKPNAQRLIAIEAYLRRHKIQAVLANYAITAFPVLEICKRNHIPLIVHFHGWTAYRKSILEKHQEDYREMFNEAAAVICVSEDMRQQLLRLGARPDRLHRVVYGYNPELFKYTDHSNNGNVFLYVGRFSDTKNPHLVILAFERVLRKVPEAKLIMAGGDESLLSACISLVKALDIEHAVDFVGVQKPEGVASLMEKSLALVQHSATTMEEEKEGTPVTIIEAMAAGLPVVATRHAGIPDIITDGETGLLVDEFDINLAAEKILQLVANRGLAQQIGLNAAVFASNHLTMRQYISNVQSIIDKVI